MNKTKFLLIVLMIMSFVSGSWASTITWGPTGTGDDNTGANYIGLQVDQDCSLTSIALQLASSGTASASYMVISTADTPSSVATSNVVGYSTNQPGAVTCSGQTFTYTFNSLSLSKGTYYIYFTTVSGAISQTSGGGPGGGPGGQQTTSTLTTQRIRLIKNTTYTPGLYWSSTKYTTYSPIFTATATVAKTLSSIAISGSPTQTTYEAGDALNTAGLTVTGTYDDGTTETITDGITWTPNPATLSAGATSCGVTATVSGVSSSEYTVTGLTVNASTKQTLYDNDASSSASSAHYYRIPAIAVDPSGNLYAYADYRTTPGYDIGGGDDGTTNHIDIQVRKSTDNGANWTDIATAVSGQSESSTNDFDYAHGDAAVVADREGKGFLMMSASGKVRFINSTTSAPIRVGRYTSTDGVTWTGSDVTSTIYGINFSGAANSVTGVFFSSGRICQSRFIKVGNYYRLYAALDAYYKNGSTAVAQGSIAVYSDDFGETWKQLGTTIPAASGDEAKIEELPNGNVLISSRMSGGRYFNIYTYTSRVSGAGAWSTVATSNSSSGGTYSQNCSANGEILIVPAKNSSNDNCYVALQSIPLGGTTSGLSGRENLGVYYKVFSSFSDFDYPEDFTTGWSLLKQINSTSSCYSTMVLDKNGDIAFLYEEGKTGEGYNIKFQTLSLSSLTSGAYTYSADLYTEDNNNDYLDIDTYDDFVGKTVTLKCVGSSTPNEYLYNNSNAIGTISTEPTTSDTQYQFIVAKGFNGGYTFQSVSNTSLYLGVATSSSYNVALESAPAEFILTKSNKSSKASETAETMTGYALQYLSPKNISSSDNGIVFVALKNSDGTATDHLSYTTTNYNSYSTDFTITPVGTYYNVTCSTASHGTVTASSTTAAEGATVTLSNTADFGYTLDSYSVVKTDDATTVELNADGTSFTMPAYDVTVSATFKVSTITPNSRPFAIKVNGQYIDKSNDGSVVLSSSAYPFNFNAVGDVTGAWSIQGAGGGTYLAPSGSSTIGQSASYTWTIAGSNDACTIADANGTYLGYNGTAVTSGNATATTFELVPLYIVWPETSENGSVGVSGYQSVMAGTTVQLTNTPDEGYVLQSYTVTFTDGNNVQQTFVVGSTGTFEMPAYDVHVTGTFVKAYTVTISDAISGGTVTASAENAYEGETITLTNEPNSSYAFSAYSVTDADGAAVTVTDGKFTMPASNVTVSATFVEAAYKVTCTATNCTVVSNPTGANAGTSVTITVTPKTNYDFTSLTVGGSSVSATAQTDGTYTYTFNMPSSDVAVVATCTKKTTGLVYALKTDVTIQTDRSYLIVYQATADAKSGILMNSSFTGNTFTPSGSSTSTQGTAAGSTVTISDSKTITTDEANSFNIENSTTTTGSYYIKNHATTRTYFGTTSSSLWFATSTSGIDNTISLSTTNAGFATIKSYDSKALAYDPDKQGFFYEATTQPYIYEEVVGYTITDESEDGGYITCNYTSADAGTSVTLTVHPNGGYEFKSLTVDGATVTPVGSSDGTYTYTFTMPSHNVTVKSTYNGLYDGAAVYLECIGYNLASSSSFTYYLTDNSTTLTANASTPATGEFTKYLFKVTTKDGGYIFESLANPGYYLVLNSSNNLVLSNVTADNATVLTFVKTGRASGNTGTEDVKTMTGYALQYTGSGYSDDGIRFAAVNNAGTIDHINYTSDRYAVTKDGTTTYYSSDFTMIIKYKLTWDQKNVHAYSIDLSKSSSSTGVIDLTDADIAGAYEFLGSVKNANSLIYVEDDHDFTSTTYPKNIVVNTDGKGTYTCASLVLTDKVDVSIPYAFKAANATYVRESTSTIGTLILPYAPISKTGYKYYELTQENVNESASTAVGGTITFTSIDSPQPNTPYLYSNSTGKNFDMTTTDASVVVTAKYPNPDVYSVDTKDGNWDMVGVYEKTTVFAEANGGSSYSEAYNSITNYKTVDANSYYIKDVQHFAKVNGYFNNLPFRAYFSTTAENSAKFAPFSFMMVDDTTPTDIIDVEDNADGTVKVIYDLSGRRLNEAHPGQVNIINGKKVFVK